MSYNCDDALTVVLTTVGLSFGYILLRNRAKLLRTLRYHINTIGKVNPLKHKQIQVIDTPVDCNNFAIILREHCRQYRVLGFDCEWVTYRGNRRPIALLQLASHNGFCALIRICKLQQLPDSLIELLRSEDIIKVGVVPIEDAYKLCLDYDVHVNNTFDLRFLAVMANREVGGLSRLSKDILNVDLDKDWRVSCSDWEAEYLDSRQLNYAADDALAAIEIFKTLSKEIMPRSLLSNSYNAHKESIFMRINPFLDVPFSKGAVSSVQNGKQLLKTVRYNRSHVRKFVICSQKVYDNCELLAPDGQLLCLISRKKAEWYLMRDLGEQIIPSATLTVRLKFNPAARASGKVAEFFQQRKHNQCVVCGKKDSYIRKNIVPREYRKHFPVCVKEHSSHDLLLLCPLCHQRSNISDQHMRNLLAMQCNAPFTKDDSAMKYYENQELKIVKSAARALLKDNDKIPNKRKAELKDAVMRFYKDANLTQELLNEAANINVYVENANYFHHGQKVVEHFEEEPDGVFKLMKLWRQHFLTVMAPKFLPHFWDINHKITGEVSTFLWEKQTG